LRYAWDGTRRAGARIVPGTVFADGKPLDPNARYRVAVNSYLADGGDGYSTFKQGTDVSGGPNDVEALIAYLAASPRRAQPQQGRISRIDR
jgi:5'-nucleotidase